MKKYNRYRTFAEQIKYNANDHCIAYSQCEMAFYAKKENEQSQSGGGSSNEKIKQVTDKIRNGKEAGLGEMIVTAKNNGVELKVVDDKSYVRTHEEIDRGIEVVYVESGTNNDISHA